MVINLRNIILCGFMGCGKSTVGRRLAELTDRRFIDMDDWIVKKAGISINEIFSRLGEDEFRRYETDACNILSAQQGLVIAAGGGALTFAKNVSLLSKTGDIVLLDVPLDVILRRIKGDTTRPLLARSDRDEAAQALYDARIPLYRRAAGYIVNGEGSAQEVAQSIIEILKTE
ncbi:MAG: shikimate kinase [Oscillospiraceae bacterium]|nr:shikimate kinase [Oscillospiraceae bacterium]